MEDVASIRGDTRKHLWDKWLCHSEPERCDIGDIRIALIEAHLSLSLCCPRYQTQETVSRKRGRLFSLASWRDSLAQVGLATQGPLRDESCPRFAGDGFLCWNGWGGERQVGHCPGPSGCPAT